MGSWNIGSLCGRGTEVCEELRARRVDVCCVQEVRWRGQGARFIGVQGRRYKLWWSGSETGIGGVGILMKEELCENTIEVRRRSDRVMALVLAFRQEVIRVICAYGPQSGRPDKEKEDFYDDMAKEWDLNRPNETILGFGDFNGHVGKRADGFEGVHGGNGFGERNLEGRRLLEFCDEKELNETEIDYIIVGKGNRKYLKNVKVIP